MSDLLGDLYFEVCYFRSFLAAMIPLTHILCSMYPLTTSNVTLPKFISARMGQYFLKVWHICDCLLNFAEFHHWHLRLIWVTLETLQNTYFFAKCHYNSGEVESLTLTESLSILPPLLRLLANCVWCTQTLGHTKAVQAITHHGLS